MKCKECGKEFEPLKKNQVFCPSGERGKQSPCAIKWHNRKRRQGKRNRTTAVECICPKCGEHHLMELTSKNGCRYEWTGSGTIRKYCPYHRAHLFGANGRLDYSYREGGSQW